MSAETHIILCDVLCKSPDHDSVVRWLRLIICPFIFITAIKEKTNLLEINKRNS